MGVEPRLDAPASNFLGLPEASSGPHSRVWVLPVPYEATTTYGRGAKLGPAAIIAASAQVELYDRRLNCEPALDFGVHTLPPLLLDDLAPAAAVGAIAAQVRHLSDPGRLLCVLGGEHGLSIGVARALHEVFGDFATVQIDAHADLRDSYEETPLSHACAARRILDQGGSLTQLGVRSLDISEAEFLRGYPDRVRTFFACDMLADKGYLTELAGRLTGKRVYLTIDVDCLDPCVMPATGTPEPGGLGWYDVVEIVATIARAAHVIAFDCVELAPIPGLHHADFTAAKLVYQAMCSIMWSSFWAKDSQS